MRRLVPVLWSQLACLFCLAAAEASPLFDHDAVLEIDLRGPLGETLRDKSERNERPFKVVVDGDELDVMVRVRGKSRADTCRFPPLRLDFGNPEGSVFAGQGALKLVTHCNKSASDELNVLEEYAVYRLFDLLAPAAVRVRLLRIRYTDSEKPGKGPIERFAFLLESRGELAQRLGGELVEVEGLRLGDLDRRQIADVFVAQYLVGNADYSLVMADRDDSCCHNGILVDVRGQLVYVPYDFDRSRLVDARYARAKGVNERRARGRRYVGYCVEGLDLEAAINRVRGARKAIFDEIHALEAVSGHEFDKARRVLDGFFREAEDPARLAARFGQECLD